jgi:hypothetical protein
VEVVDHVVPRERVPPEDDLRFLRRRLKELRLLSARESGGQEQQKEGRYPVTFVSAS